MGGGYVFVGDERLFVELSAVQVLLNYLQWAVAEQDREGHGEVRESPPLVAYAGDVPR